MNASHSSPSNTSTRNYLDQFRDPQAAQHVLQDIRQNVRPEHEYRLMEFCGGHTHTLFRYGIPDTLPDNIKMLHGPGCPVCVLPIKQVDAAIALAQREDCIVCSYGDALRIPGTGQNSLLKEKARGSDVRMVVTPADCLVIAKENPGKKVVFLALGFETTTPPTAVVLDQAVKQQFDNFFVFCNHVLTPPAMRGILDMQASDQNGQPSSREIDGFVGPGHVSLVTGYQAFESIAEHYQVPIVVSGFEPLDLLYSILMLVRQINEQRHIVENQYTRAVHQSGNVKAQQLCDQYFELREAFEWRGLGILPASALKIRPEFQAFDAEQLLPADLKSGQDNKACECPAVLLGRKSPFDCKLFDNPCTPENPLGSCMVSSEGACAAYYRYQRNQSKPEAQNRSTREA